MTKFEKFLNQEVKIKDIDVVRNIYVASLGMFIFTAMFSSLFGIAYGNEVTRTATVYNATAINKVHIQDKLAINDTVSQVISTETIKDIDVIKEKPELVFALSAQSAKKGEIVMINWSAKGADKCTLMQNNKIISNAVKGDIISDPINDATLIWMSCSNEAGSVIASSQVSAK